MNSSPDKTHIDLADRWANEIDQLMLVAKKKQARILGFTSATAGIEVADLCSRVADRYARFEQKTLLIDLSGGREGAESGSKSDGESSDLGAAPALESAKSEGAALTRLTPGVTDLSQFGSAENIAQTLAAKYADYGKIILHLPSMFENRRGITSLLQAATVCEGLFVVCLTGQDRRPQVREMFASLKTAGIKVDGLVVKEDTVSLLGCFAGLFRLGGK
ncbi:MAG: hypothetical protein L3J67_05020 [Hyphomicrobiaceae bacterium]|nr:hypothetical protein [Hyphomicrobiaceae bacterium]